MGLQIQVGTMSFDFCDGKPVDTPEYMIINITDKDVHDLLSHLDEDYDIEEGVDEYIKKHVRDKLTDYQLDASITYLWDITYRDEYYAGNYADIGALNAAKVT